MATTSPRSADAPSSSSAAPVAGAAAAGKGKGAANNEPPTTLKLLFIGSSSVGKSSLLLRFMDEGFFDDSEMSTTIGVDFRVRVVNRKGKKWKLSIWDTAGQERFRSLTSSYYRGAQGVILVYDITARDTFEALPSWIQELDTFAGSSSSSREIVRLIVGNKLDKEHARQVSRAEGEQFASSRDPPWMFAECSAKRGGRDVVGDDGLLLKVVDEIIDKPALYTKVARQAGGASGPPGAYPRGGASTVELEREMEGSSSWCSC